MSCTFHTLTSLHAYKFMKTIANVTSKSYIRTLNHDVFYKMILLTDTHCHSVNRVNCHLLLTKHLTARKGRIITPYNKIATKSQFAACLSQFSSLPFLQPFCRVLICRQFSRHKSFPHPLLIGYFNCWYHRISPYSYNKLSLSVFAVADLKLFYLS